MRLSPQPIGAVAPIRFMMGRVGFGWVQGFVVMAADRTEDESRAQNAAQFATTHWSVVLAAGDSASPDSKDALERLCRTYWRPLYAYVRRQGRDVEEAKDLTQAFFERFIDRRYFAHASPQSGRFRSFLLTSLKNFLVNDWEHTRAQRRGSGQRLISLEAALESEAAWAEPVDTVTPETAYEQQWAWTLIESALSNLEREYVASDHLDLFQVLRTRLWGTEDPEPYAQAAQRTGRTEGALKIAAHRLRRRYGELLREEIAQTVAQPTEIDDELRHLLAVLGRTT